MTTGESALRTEIIAVAQALDAAGMVPNKSGNVSCRSAGGFVITPAGTPYRDLLPSDLVELPVQGTPPRRRHGRRRSGACTPRSTPTGRTPAPSCTPTVRGPLRSPVPVAAFRHSIT